MSTLLLDRQDPSKYGVCTAILQIDNNRVIKNIIYDAQNALNSSLLPGLVGEMIDRLILKKEVDHRRMDNLMLAAEKGQKVKLWFKVRDAITGDMHERLATFFLVKENHLLLKIYAPRYNPLEEKKL